MLSWIAATAGGIIKDVTVGAEKAWDVITDEVSSVPDAFSQGLEHGLFTGEDLPKEEHDHHVDIDADPEHNLSTTHVDVANEGRKFGTRHVA